MKKLLKFAVIAAVLLVALTVTVGMAAAKYGPPTRPVNPPTGTNFVDADGDGICDLAGTANAYSYGNACQSAYGTGSGLGIGSRGTAGRLGQGSFAANRYQTNFVDADGDGICDCQQ